LLQGDEAELDCVKEYVVYDERVQAFRAQAHHYAPIILALREKGAAHEDFAKGFEPLDLKLVTPLTPRSYQTEALAAWTEAGRRGVVALPTGAGKTVLAVMAMARVKRPALVVVPTIDLTRQWAGQLERFFGVSVGMLGGGCKEVLPLTVSTYDSAVLMMEFIGNRFGLVVFDECHHLPGAVNRFAASMCAAPFRLGLSATPERDDGGDQVLEELVGPLVYNIHIDQLEGNALSCYDVVNVPVSLDPDEQEEYQRSREIYLSFARAAGVNFGAKDGWNQFLAASARRPGGRQAFEAYLKQKRISSSGRGKARMVWELLNEHKGERVIIFTNDNDTAYSMGEQFFLPVITHRAKPAERKEMLDKFRCGDYPVLVTSKVLNEGVDVPEASVGIIVSGSGSSREHVQRLGRFLRPAANKRALLYELVSEDTAEVNVSIRRGNHRAFLSKSGL